MGISTYKPIADDNVSISGINIAEGCPPSGINNAIRQLMADTATDVAPQVAKVPQIEQKLFQNNGAGPLLNAAIVPAPVLPMAAPTQTGAVFAGAAAGKVYASGDSAYAFTTPAYASEITGGAPSAGRLGFPAMVDVVGLKPVLDAKLDAATYTADAPTRIMAWVTTNNAGTIIWSNNVTSVTRLSTGRYQVFSPAIKPSSSIVASAAWYSGNQNLFNEDRPARVAGSATFVNLNAAGAYVDCGMNIIIAGV